MLAQRQRRVARIALTPLVDVVFILLLFFLLTSVFSTETSLELSVAESRVANTTDRESPPPVRLLVGDDDSVTVDGERYTLDSDGLFAAISAGNDSSGTFTVTASSTVTVQQLITALDLLVSAGATNIDVTETSSP